MPTAHGLGISLCFAATLVPATVTFAQGVFDMGALTNTMAQGAIVKSERERAIRMGQGDPLAGRKSASRKVKINPSVLIYKPSLAARKRNLERFAGRIGVVDPVAAQGLRKAYAKGDPIAQAAPILRKIGLNPNNVADAMSVYLVTAWHASRGDDKGTPAEYRAVSAQLTRAVASNPSMLRVSNEVKQETAETMILNALLVDASVTDALKNRSKLPGVRTVVVQGAQRTFGFNLTKLRIGVSGLY